MATFISVDTGPTWVPYEPGSREYTTILGVPNTLAYTAGSRQYAMMPAEDTLGGITPGGGTTYRKRGVYAPGGTPTEVFYWEGLDPSVLDATDQSDYPSGDVTDVGVVAVVVT